VSAEPSTPTDVAGRDEHDARKAELRAEMERARTLYHELAALADRSNWTQKSGNPAWTVGQMLGHIVMIFSAVPMKLGRVRKGKGIPKPPDFIFNPLNEISTRLGTRKYRPENVVEGYDRAHEAALAELEKVEPHEWPLGATFFGEYQDVEEIFRYPCKHVAEHEHHIRDGVTAAKA
jgi:hypothetical protein